MKKQKQFILSFVFSLAFLTGLLVVSPKIASAATISVNSTSDTQSNDGSCTLREAIIAANTDTASGAAGGECIAGAGTDTIEFSIAGAGVKTIAPATTLPDITQTVNINGYTQGISAANTAVAPAALNGTLLVEINGTSVTGHVLNFTGGAGGSAGSSVRGLVINRSPGVGILLSAQSITIAGNYIGTSTNGLADLGNTGAGITHNLGIGTNATIGGLNPADRNIISGNEDAAAYPATGWVIRGNYIGVDATGLVAMGNSTPGASGGLSIDNANDVIVGGSQTGAINVISGNNNQGIAPDVTQNLIIQGNYIGVGRDGTTAVPNGHMGIDLANSTGTIVGGKNAGEGNIISRNTTQGLYVKSGNNGVTIQGNTVNNNGNIGILIDNCTNIVIGGTQTGEGNTISNNTTDGVYVSNAATNITVQGNTIASNSGSGVTVINSSAVVGGTQTGAGNTITGSGTFGVLLSAAATNTTVQGNTISGSTNDSISVNASVGNVIGGTQTGAGNTITTPNTYGISVLAGANNTTVQGNSITGAKEDGIYVNASTGAIIGGTQTGAGNTVATTTKNAINISSAGTATVQGNTITGSTLNGILFTSSATGTIGSNTVSGSGQSALNLTSSNSAVITGGNYTGSTVDGISLTSSNSVAITGVNASNNIGNGILAVTTTSLIIRGSTIQGNTGVGVGLSGTTGTIIGGTSTTHRNLISGNAGTSNINIVGVPDLNDGTVIQGNYIGVNGLGALDSGITQNMGISISGNVTNSLIGGSDVGAGNIIAGSRSAGITIAGLNVGAALNPSGNAILGNSIYSSAAGTVFGAAVPGLGIDLLSVDLTGPPALSQQGPTFNDVNDIDIGPNNYMNFPVINSATQVDNNLTVSLNLDAADSTLNGKYRISIFANDTADATGYGEGQTYLGYADIANGNAQNINIALVNGTNLTGKILSATTTALTNDGDGFGATSEFSQTSSINVISFVDLNAKKDLANTGFNVMSILLIAGALIIAGCGLVIRRLDI